MSSQPGDAVAVAVEAAIVAAAHNTAYDRVLTATEALRRLGALSKGRWRAAARDLERIQDELERSLDQVEEEVERRAAEIGVPEEALTIAGAASTVFDDLREDALDLLDEDSPAYALLDGQILYGTILMADEESDDRGTTLLFGWPDPLSPAAWRWESSWVAGSADDAEDADGDGDTVEELDLYPLGDLEVSEALLDAVVEQIGGDRESAAEALAGVAEAITRASLEATLDDEDEDDEDEADSTNGHI